MKTINITDLKNNLSLYLKKVHAGEEIIIKDRDVIVAKIIPWHGRHDDELLALANQGMIRLGKGEIENHFWQMPTPQVSAEDLRNVITAESEDA